MRVKEEKNESRDVAVRFSSRGDVIQLVSGMLAKPITLRFLAASETRPSFELRLSLKEG